MHPDKVKKLLDRIGTLKKALKQANEELRTLRPCQRREAHLRQMLDQHANIEEIRKLFP